MEVSGQIHAPVALPPRKEPHMPIGWVGSRVGVDTVEYRHISCPSGNQTPAVQPVAILIEVSQLEADILNGAYVFLEGTYDRY
jgi:hypothetical protein